LDTGYIRPLHRIPIMLFGLVRSPIKNLNLNQNLHFWFISSIYPNLWDHVNSLRCLKRKCIIDKKDLSWIISLCDLEQSYSLSIYGRSLSNKDPLKQSKILSSYDPSPLSLLKLFILSYPSIYWPKIS
jgi:hypothetical protein